MSNIIREDIVKVTFDTNLKDIQKLQNELNDLKKKVTGDMGSDAIDDLNDSVNKTIKPMQKLKEQAEKVTKEVTNIGKKAATTAYNGLKKVASVSFKTLAVGVGLVATAVGGLVAKSVQAYADFEQLKGGVETLFKDSAGTVQQYANNAYKTAGLSANAYMETVTGFSASLLQSLDGDTKKAAKYADMAVSDMADNANKMGTDMSSIQYAYQGFAKQNYTMLDNLKLGYGGTKEEMQRLVKDASKIDSSIDANSLSYANIVKSIHAVQQEMGIYGTTAKEAEKTITGSLNAMKSSWGNLLTAMASGENLDQCIDNMVSSVETFGENIMPVAEKALGGIATVVERLTPIIADKLPDLAEKLLPPLIKATIELTKGLIKALPNIIRTLFSTIVDICGDQFPVLKKLGKFFSDNAEKIAKFIPVIIGLVGAFKLFGGIKSIASLFGGGKSSGGGGLGGIVGGLANTVEELGKKDSTSLLKGMGNLAIIVGGFTILTALFMTVAPEIAKIGDIGSLLKMVAVMGALGVVSMVLAKTAEIAGAIPVKTVALGLANMAIMLAGMSALFLLLGAISLIQFDYGRIMEIVGVIGVLGILGTVLSAFAMILGGITLATGGLGIAAVALGLANMAIMIAGVATLYMLIGAVSLINFDINKVMQVTKIIGIIGAIGTALTIFATILGAVPVTTVLLGLANMALVLGGLTAIIMAFGKLSEVKGFNDLVSKGGDFLAKLFREIGKALGSLIGGIGEGLSNSLPKIGDNLSKFAKTLGGTNFDGISNLFNALGAVKELPSSGGVFQYFTGDPYRGLLNMVGLLPLLAPSVKSFYSQLGNIKDFSALSSLFNSLGAVKELPKAGGYAQFFTGDPYKGLMALIIELPYLGTAVGAFYANLGGVTDFSSLSSLFNALSSIKDLPKAGGYAQFFTGNPYTALAALIVELPPLGTAVGKFFANVGSVSNFDLLPNLFNALSSVKDLPKSGGYAQFFTGNQYTALGSMILLLPSLGNSVKSFFNSISGIDDFGKITELFTALGSLDESVDKDGGVFGAIKALFTGSEESTIFKLGTTLEVFGNKTKNFFASVNALNLNNLNGLWDSLKNAEGLTNNISKIVDDNINDIVDKISDLPTKMGEALKGSGKTLGDSLVEMWKEAVKASVAPVNKVLDAANWILREFGSKKRVIEWTPYAKGTGGHKGGNALVNDGNGAELVQMPNGNMFIPRGRNVLLPNAPKGMKVLPAGKTAQLMGRRSPTFKYANGIGDIDLWSYYDNPEGLASKIAESVSYEGMSGFSLALGKGMVSTFTGEMGAWIKKLFEEEGQSISSYVASKGVTQWLPTIVRALKMEGQYSLGNVARTLFQMKTESGGNPKAINLWDRNAKKGTPSKGLMQVIDPTFQAYARDGFDKNIYDPLSNILASVRYATSRYGSLSKAYRGVGYSKGVGSFSFADQPSSFNLAYTPESDSDYYSSSSVEYNSYAPQFNFTISGAGDERTLTRKIKKVAVSAIKEAFDEIERGTPKLREV